MPRLAVFDIDGTLTDTNAVDDECYLHAVADVLDLDAVDLDWSGAPHVTDSGILGWICQRHCGRPLSDEEASATLARFVELLKREIDTRPHRFAAIPGAHTTLEQVRAAGWVIALATGGWEESARIKLAAAGLEVDACAFASATDSRTRTEILELAMTRALTRGTAPFTRIVSIGDGVWDVRAAAELGWPFVGVGRDGRGTALRTAGASVVLPDLCDFAAFHTALHEATVPR